MVHPTSPPPPPPPPRPATAGNHEKPLARHLHGSGLSHSVSGRQPYTEIVRYPRPECIYEQLKAQQPNVGNSRSELC